jgi:hypothetical protein
MGDATLEELIECCRQYDGNEPGQELIDASNAFLNVASNDNSIIVNAANALGMLPPLGAGWMSGLLGFIVEHGVSPNYSLDSLLTLYLNWLDLLCKVKANIDNAPHDNDISGISNAFTSVSRSLVTHLASAPSKRNELFSNSEVISKLEDIQSTQIGACWVLEAISRYSDKVILVHPKSGIGLKINYENVSTCFHLFSLLQVCVEKRIPEGRTPQEDVKKALLGQADKLVYDFAWWHYGNAHSPTPNIMTSIFGEENVRSIPRLNGQQVIILWDNILNRRSWDSSFFGPYLQALPSKCVIENELLYAVGIKQPKPWWRIW